MKRILLCLIAFSCLLSLPAQAEWRSLGGWGKDVALDMRERRAWTLGQDDRVYSFAGNGWQEYPGNGRGLAIAVGPDGTPFVIGIGNGIHRGTGSGWVELPGGGKGKDIAVDGRGHPWIIGMDDDIYSHNGFTWTKYPGGGRGLAIAVSVDGIPFVIGYGNGIHRGTGGGWVELPGGGKGKDIAVDRSGRVWVIGMDDAIYYHQSGSWIQLPGGGRGHRIAVDEHGNPMVVGLDNAIWIGDRPQHQGGDRDARPRFQGGSGQMMEKPIQQSVRPAMVSGAWRSVGTGDCPGSDVAGTQGAYPDPDKCNDRFAGFTAVCWNNNCTYKNVPTNRCTGGANPGRMYSCER